MEQHLTKILIIDDELLLRNGIKYLCNWEENGFTIAGEASNGLEALHMIAEIQPDIILTDIIMSVMDGIEFTKKLKEQYPWIHIIVLSSYDDFEYVKSLFKLGVADYLLKPALDKDELLALMNRLRSASPGIRSHASAAQTLKELLHGGTLCCPDALQRFRDAHTDFLETEPYLLLTGKILSDISFYTFEKKIAPEIAGQFAPHSHAFCISDEGYLCILLQTVPENKDLVPALSTALVTMLERKTGRKMIFTLSEPYNDLSCTLTRYKDCIRLLEYSFYFPERELLYPEDIKASALPFPQQEYQKNLDPLYLPGVRHLLRQYVRRTVESPSTEVFVFKKQIESALYSLILALTMAGFDTSGINMEKVKYFKMIDKAPDYAVLDKILDDFFLLVNNLVQRETARRDLDLFYQIKSYIADNCNQDLKLSDIAQAFHLNYTYLSTLFYQKTNEHFSDYLNKVRIEKARHLLQTQKLSIAQVSEQAGFINQGYFSKIFKKYTEMSPREYQKIYQRGK